MPQLHTTYEIAAEHPDGRRLLVVYAARKTKSRLVEIIRERYETIAAATGHRAERVENWIGGTYPACSYGEWRIRYTGRTRLQAIAEGPLPFASNVAAAV
jgi:hypothetical protein